MQIISGGQSGVDRAALDAALARGIDYGGWCPRGGWAEDFPASPGLLAKYPKLRPTPRRDPAQRTLRNVRDADACLIIVDAGGTAVSAGTSLAQTLAHRHRKPLLIVNLGDAKGVDRAALWLSEQEARHGARLKLTVGGPRESEAPGIYARAMAFIGALLERCGR